MARDRMDCDLLEINDEVNGAASGGDLINTLVAQMRKRLLALSVSSRRGSLLNLAFSHLATAFSKEAAIRRRRLIMGRD